MLSNKTLVITRTEVERCDIEAVARRLAPERFSEAELAGLCGAVRIRFEHAASADDLFVKPEARRFVQCLHKTWPWAGYFLRCKPIETSSPHAHVIDVGVLVGWALCLTGEIEIVRWDEPDVVGMRFNHHQFGVAVEDIVDSAEQMCAIVGLPKSSIHQRRTAIMSSIASFFSLGEQGPLP